MAYDWAADFKEFVAPYYDLRWFSLIGLMCWFCVHFAAGYFFNNSTNWVQNAANQQKASDEKKGKKVKSEAYYLSTQKWQMSVKAVALVHALASSCASLYAIATSDTWQVTYESLYEKNEFKAFVVAASGTYFLYDLVIAIIDMDPPFLMHGFMASTIYLHAAGRQFCLQLGCFFLLYEYSTIALNIRALMISAGKTDHPIFPWVERLFFVMFIFFRDLIGMVYSFYYMMPVLVKTLWDNPQPPHSYIAIAMFIISNTSINLLNVVWTKSMLAILQGKGKHNAKAEVKKD